MHSRVAGSFRANQLSGYRGLVAAIIARAVLDLRSKNAGVRADAAEYFRGELYRTHLDFLGVDDRALPEMGP